MNKQTYITLIKEQELSDQTKQTLVSFLDTCSEVLTEDQVSDFRKLLVGLESKIIDDAVAMLDIDMSGDQEISQAGEEYSAEVGKIMSEFKQEHEEAENALASFDEMLKDVEEAENEVKIQELRESI